MKYRVFDLKFSAADEERFASGCKAILREGFLTNHTHVTNFESAFSGHQLTPYALAVNNGTAALEIALRALDVKDKYVFVQSNTFIATAVAIIAAGGIPYILDVEDEWFGLCPNRLLSALEKTPQQKRGAIVSVHIGGHIAPSFNQTVQIAKDFSIPLIEDCAQSHFAKLNDTLAGNSGNFGCFSFFTTKTMTTGEGGMVVTGNKELHEQAKMIRRFGMDPNSTTDHIRDGGNFKMTEFSALLGEIELERVDQRIAKRRELAKTYQKLLNADHFRALGDPPKGFSTHYKQIVMIKNSKSRVELESFLNEHGIPLTGGVYYKPLHQQKSVQEYSLNGPYNNSQLFADVHFCPPCYPELEVKDIEFICEKINEWGKA